MSWFNASHLSSFAKQALSQAQKSIDRVLDIQEDEHAWGDTILPTFEQGSSLSIGTWDVSNWGTHSNEDSETQMVSSTTAITKPVRRTVVDESENFFSAFLTPVDVQTIESSTVVSKPPSKSQRPKEDVTNTLQEPEAINQPEMLSTETLKENVPSVTVQPHIITSDEPYENFEPNHDLFKPDDQHNENVNTVPLSSRSAEVLNTDVHVEYSPGEDDLGSALKRPSASIPSETKDSVLVVKEPKTEDRQSNTPSPPISTFSSGTSTTSDIEVLDHDSVISESSASSRQEATDSKSSLHLMQTSFQLLSASACTEYSNLDDFPKLTESCSSSDAFERIDSFSVQSMDSRSVSEINSDDELSGKGCALISAAVSPPAPKTDSSDSLENKADDECNETLVVQVVEEAEMEEMGRSATPVNMDQPDLLVLPIETNEKQSGELVADLQEFQTEDISVTCENEDTWKVITDLTEKLEKRETQLLTVSKEKAQLEEAYDNLKDEMFRVKEESSSIISLKEEFTLRIAEAEKKVLFACKERDLAKKEVKSAKEELATRLNSNETAELMKERDEQIKGLMEEGEKLSKQQLHNSNIIKKLRVKEKENENTITKQAKKIKELEEELQHFKQDNFQALYFSLKGVSKTPFNGILIYRPPGPRADFGQQLLHILEPYFGHEQLTILGDLNYHLEKLEASDTLALLDAMSACGLNQLVRGATHQAGHTLDGVFSNDGRLVVKDPLPLSWSDHFAVPIEMTCLIAVRNEKIPSKMEPRSNFKNISNSSLAPWISSMSTSQEEDVHLAVSQFEKADTMAFDELAPARLRNSARKKASAPWISEHLRLLRQGVRRQEHLWHTSWDLRDKEAHKILLRGYKGEVIRAKQEYFTALTVSLSSPKELFKIVDSLTSLQIPDPVITSQQLCNNLALFFQSKIADIYSALEPQRTFITEPSVPCFCTSSC
ncbi:TATA element modulatory factor-like [Lissotriton helveticus]